MRNFAPKPKATEHETAASRTGPASMGRLRDQSSALHLQRALGNQIVCQLLEPPTGPRGGGASSGGVAPDGHAVSRPPLQADRSASETARLSLDAGNHAGERGRTAGVLSVRTVLRPHEGSPAALQQEAAIYAQGKTPLRVGGQVAAMDSTPLGAQETGAHLREIERQFGATGVQQSVRGLQHTRGASFANSAEEHAGFSPAARSREGGAIGERAATAIRASSASGLLPTDVREKLTNASGQDFDGVAIHDDAHAHRAAELLHARAFTVGRAIYFARNEYQPTTSAGMHLLAHEAAHTVQQQGQSPAVDAHALTTATGDRSEEEASHFADSVTGRHATAAPTLTPSSRTGLVHRAISFTHAGDAFTRNNVVATEIGGGFRLASDPTPSFQWDTNVTIHGAPGDPFANFEVGFHQVERVFGVNVHWGNGTNATHRNIRPDAPLPRRDATAAGNTWYNDGAPTLAAAFAANGDVRSPSFDDSPGTPVFPFANPVAGRVGNTGWFNYSDAFVTYLSARDTTRGTGAAAFRHIANVYWNLSAAGNFDGGRAAGTRVTLTTTGAVNTSRVMEGGSGEFPSMHGGIIANGHDTTTDT